jgi:hypothetical protein
LQELQDSLKGKLLTFEDELCCCVLEIFLDGASKVFLEAGGQDFEKFL